MPWEPGFPLFRIARLRGLRYGVRLLLRIRYGPAAIRRSYRWAGYSRAAAHRAERAYRQTIVLELDELMHRRSGIPGDGEAKQREFHVD